MATANPLGEDNFQFELNRVREKIKTKFIELVDCLKDRENQLLRNLDNILASYLSFPTELEKVNNEKKRDLETTKVLLQNQLLTSNNSIHFDNIISQITTEIKSTKTPIEPKMVSFECDSNKMLAELNKLGRLVEKGIDYKSKKQPLVSVCKKGSGIGQLDWPFGVAVDNKTENIYITDHFIHCVKVFDSTGMYLFKFGNSKRGEKMEIPLSLAIYGDRILVTQGNNSISNYQLDGKFISRVGKGGKGVLEFDRPNGLAIDGANGDIYVSDRCNNRIQKLSKYFTFKTQFGIGILKRPRDVKLTKEYIYVLDQSNPCLHLFNYNHILLKSAISRGEGMQVICPFYFFIDPRDNILISDRDSNSIHVFNTEYQLAHKIPVSPNPMGIAVDFRGRVIVVCRAENNCLQIF